MRRGRPGFGGWRSDKPRHFRPRSGGTQHMRPPRNYGLFGTPRFPPPGAALHRPPPPPFDIHPNNEAAAHDIHERNKYKHFPHTQHRPPDRGGHLQQRLLPPYFNKPRQYNDSHFNPHQSNTFENSDQAFQGHINDMGDIDHRQPQNASEHRDNYKRHTTWINPAIENKIRFYDKSPQKYHKNHETTESIRQSSEEYTGHRPPSSDHYGGSCNPGNNNKAFTRSVDDTVDIIRKKLRDRSDSQQLTSQESIVQSNNDQTVVTSNQTYSDNQQEPPTKRRIQRPAQVKSNCDKIKNNIVHQLFKMDKNKIHKLMDNPSSSTKFEYAISSLITESQNSLNRQLRSVAEKSLNYSNDNYINDDTNTIYEDTFMKQMQCILDPQDTVFLEDIKPIVMAELNKVLQLDDYVQGCNSYEESQNPHQSCEQPELSYYDETYEYDDQPCNYENKLYEQELASELYFNNTDKIQGVDDVYATNQESIKESVLLYERRPVSERRKSEIDEVDRRLSTESQRTAIRRSIEAPHENTFSTQNTVPLFDSSAEHFSEDDDPFAELDKQYHVAVDHNFIDNGSFGSPAQSVASSCNKSPISQCEMADKIPTTTLSSVYIKQDIDTQLESFAKSPLKFQSSEKSMQKNNSEFVDHSKENVSSTINNEKTSKQKCKDVEIKKEISTRSEVKNDIQKSEHCSIIVKTTTSNTRKRSLSDMPSHRKEKRKKSESSPTDTDQHVSNKYNSTCLVKSQGTAKDVFAVSLPKENKESSINNKKENTTDKSTAEKYVKRKKESRKSKDGESKKNNSNSTNHSILIQKDNTSLTISSQTSNKSDAKNKLKTIDMFMDQPKKSTPIHYAHRNTATTPAVSVTKSPEENKTKQTSSKLPSKVTVNHASTQVMRKVNSKEVQTTVTNKTRFTQTERKKYVTKAVQTSAVSSDRKISKAADSFERMKEIDLEIQVLLQEKFKLYNSIESNDNCQGGMQSLGMTVLSVTKIDEENVEEGDTETSLSEDAIVDSFTSIPVEELEEIALETVQHEKTDSVIIEKRSRRNRSVTSDGEGSSAGPSTTKSGRKVKPPNISLLEQIITSDKPLEDIIVLDELENSPVKPNKKKSLRKPISKKKSVRKHKAKHLDLSLYNLRECTVLLERQDISPYLVQLSDLVVQQSPSSIDSLSEIIQIKSEDHSQDEQNHEFEEKLLSEDISVHDIQLDMLDVSEDIVIGDVCEVKCEESGNPTNRDIVISEEIILDNSQSSCEEVFSSNANQDEVCRMFDYSTDENLIKDSITVSGNADAVLAIESIENNFLAACLDGNVYHFNGDGQLLTTLRGSNLAVTCLTIVKEKTGTTVYTGSLDSRIRYYDLETGMEKGLECNVLSPIQTMDRAWDTVFVGTRTGFVLQFECKNNMLIPVSTVKFSEQSILALRAIKEGPRKVLLVAARSENVTIKDAQSGLLLRTLSGPKMTVYTLLFEDGKVYCGTSSHQVHVFDYSSGSHVGAHEGGKGAVCLRASGGLLFAGCYDGCVYVYREGEPRPLAQLRGPSLMLLSLAIVGTKIIAGYKDRSLYIWKIPLSILREMIL